MSAFTGTGTILRLVLRRDRIRLPAWILGITAFMAINIPAIVNVYGKTFADQVAYATTTAASVVGRVFGGPLNGPELGAIILNETFLFTAILIAFMSTLTVVRHTRQNEETGREEMLASGIIGRHTTLGVALGVTTAANLLLGGVIALLLTQNDLPTTGSIATGAALACVGITFAGVGAITAQLSESARGASSLAAIGIGIAFLARGIGDGVGELVKGGLAVHSTWPTWLSPIGWAQQLHPYTEQNWAVFGLLGLFTLICFGIAFALNAHRDVGLSIIPSKPGPKSAGKLLSSPFGLAWRLQRGTLIGWTATLLILGVIVGFIVTEFGNLIQENQQVADIMLALGSDADINNVLIGSMMSLMALATAGYALQALQRMRAEEASGRLEPVLATAVGRTQWMLSHISCALIGILTLSLVLGLSSAITFFISSDLSFTRTFVAVPAALIHIPAILVIAGFIVAIFGGLPRASVALSWSFFAICMLMGQFGAILELPQWLLNISPFSHTPFVPATDVDMIPVVILSGLAIFLMTIGLLSFKRRDLVTS